MAQPALEEPFINDVQAISVGFQFKCALLKSGQLACSGINSQGQLGSGDLKSSKMFGPSDPKELFIVRDWSRVTGATNAVSVAAGSNHACAALRDGRVFCWGGNEHQELGSGPLPFTAKAVQVVGFELRQ